MSLTLCLPVASADYTFLQTGWTKIRPDLINLIRLCFVSSHSIYFLYPCYKLSLYVLKVHIMQLFMYPNSSFNAIANETLQYFVEKGNVYKILECLFFFLCFILFYKRIKL